jgi:hypothetical protein
MPGRVLIEYEQSLKEGLKNLRHCEAKPKAIHVVIWIATGLTPLAMTEVFQTFLKRKLLSSNISERKIRD